MQGDDKQVEEIIKNFQQRAAEKCLAARYAIKFYDLARKEGFGNNDLKALLKLQHIRFKRLEAIKSKTLSESLLRKMFHPDKITNPQLKKLLNQQLLLFLEQAQKNKEAQNDNAVKATKYTLHTISFILSASPLLFKLLIKKIQKYKIIMEKIATIKNRPARIAVAIISSEISIRALPLAFQLLFIDPKTLSYGRTIKLRSWVINIIDSIIIKIFAKESSRENPLLLEI